MTEMKFKPGDVVSQFDDNHSPLCVDEIVELDESLLTGPDDQRFYMYAVSERGFGHTSLDPEKFHIVPDDVCEKFFETLRRNGIIYEDGKFKTIK